MFYEAILKGSGLFHDLDEKKSGNHFYDKYVDDVTDGRFKSPNEQGFGVRDADRLEKFLNQWSTHWQCPSENLVRAVQQIQPGLSIFKTDLFLSFEFERQGKAIQDAFETLACCGPTINQQEHQRFFT